MPRLYCDQCGRGHAARASEQEDSYRQFGEALLIVSGTLISGPWRCDGCNVRLRRGKRAVHLTAFARWAAEDLHGYDFPYERRYFVIERAEVTALGAAFAVMALEEEA